MLNELLDYVFGGMNFWHWWLIGLILIGLELFAPGSIFLWTGISALLIGTLMIFVHDIHWAWQITLFCSISILSVVLWRTYHRYRPIETDEPLLNRRSEQNIGRVVTLEEPIVNGVGHVRMDDSLWKVKGRDLPAGTRVRVTAIDGIILKVEEIKQNN